MNVVIRRTSQGWRARYYSARKGFTLGYDFSFSRAALIELIEIRAKL